MKKLLVIFVLFFVSYVTAQETKNNKTICSWANLGAGLSSVASGGSAVLGVNLQLHNILFTLQNTNHFYSSGFVFSEKSEEYTAYSILIGISNRDNYFHASASVGLGVLSGSKTSGGGLNLFSESDRKTEKIGPVMGLVLSSQLFWKIGKVIGLGVELFGNLNKSKALGGAAITLFVGLLY